MIGLCTVFNAIIIKYMYTLNSTQTLAFTIFNKGGGHDVSGDSIN